jgi:hypothetical protein
MKAEGSIDETLAGRSIERTDDDSNADDSIRFNDDGD